jgi:hypothetical protein
MTQRDASDARAPSLAEVQHRFQDAVMNGGDLVLELIPDSSRTSRNVLLGVYRHAYVSRLVEILGNDHPTLARYLGEDAFADMARAYIAARPSRRQNARWFSQSLPEFLSESRAFRLRGELADVARLERALNDAFDAKEGNVLDVGGLSRHPPEQWGDLQFAPHPAVRRFDVGTNALELWRALKDGQVPPDVTALRERERLVVWREGTMPKVRPMNVEEAMMWDEAAGGVRFAVLCELAATYADPDGAALRAAQYLQGWITSGMLSAAALVPKKRRARAPQHVLRSSS